MGEQLLFGLGTGAVIASLALGLVVAYRASGVVNFAHAALGMYVAFAYFELRRTGDVAGLYRVLTQPVPAQAA